MAARTTANSGVDCCHLCEKCVGTFDSWRSLAGIHELSSLSLVDAGCRVEQGWWDQKPVLGYEARWIALQHMVTPMLCFTWLPWIYNLAHC